MLLKSLLNNTHSKLSALLRPGKSSLINRLSNREKKYHFNTLKLFKSLWKDLGNISQLIKSFDFQFEENYEALEDSMKLKTDLNEYNGKLEFLTETEFFLAPLTKPFLKKLHKFLEMFFGIMSHSSIDTGTKLTMIKCALKASLGNPFFELSKKKKLFGVTYNYDLQNEMLKFVKNQMKYIRASKGSVLSDQNFQILKQTITFFSQLKQVFVFDNDRCILSLKHSVQKEHLRLYILDRLVSIKLCSREQIQMLMSLPTSSVKHVVAHQNFGFFKNLLMSKFARLSSAELSNLVNEVSLSMKGRDDIKFNSLGQILCSVIKDIYKKNDVDFELSLCLDPLLTNLKSAFMFQRKKTRGSNPKILERFASILCSLLKMANQKKKDIEKKENEQKKEDNKIEEEKKDDNKIEEEKSSDADDNEEKRKKSKERIQKYNEIIFTFSSESFYLMIISNFNSKYLFLPIIENLTSLNSEFANLLIGRLNKFLQMDNINLEYFLSSIFWIVDWLFEQGQFELIIRVFKGAQSALSRLNKDSKKKVFQVCFYILFRIATIHGVGNNILKAKDSNQSTKKALGDMNFTLSFDKEYEDSINDVLACSNLTSLVQKVANSPFRSFLFELLETYPDSFETFAKNYESFGTSFYCLFPPQLHKNEDYCLEPENVKKILDLLTAKFSEKVTGNEGHWISEEIFFILKKMSEFYPNAFKSWFKKYLEKNLKLAKKAKVEEADINVHSTIKDSVFSMKETDGEAFKTMLSLASESDLILNGKGEFFSLSKLFGEAMNAQTLSKIKKFGVSLYIALIFDLEKSKCQEFLPLIKNLCISYLGISQNISFPVKMNLCLMMISHPLLCKKGLGGLKHLVDIPLPHFSGLTKEESSENKKTGDYISKFIQFYLSVLNALISLNTFLKNKKEIANMIQTCIDKLIVLSKIENLESKQEKLFSAFLLFLSKAIEKNTTIKPLKYLKYMKFIRNIPHEKHPLARSIFVLLENDFFKRKVFQNNLSVKFDTKKFVKLMGHSLRLHFRHFDVSRGNILVLFSLISQFTLIGKKLKPHFLSITNRWMDLTLRDKTLNLEDYHTIINGFIKEFNEYLSESRVDWHLSFLQFLVKYLDQSVPYERKLNILEQCKDLNDQIFEYCEISNSLVLPSSSESIQEEDTKQKESKTVKKQKPGLFQKLQSILLTKNSDPSSQASKMLLFLNIMNQYKSKHIKKTEFFERINSLIPQGPKTNLDLIQYFLALYEAKKVEHNPETKFFNCAIRFFETIDSSKKNGVNFSSSRNLAKTPLRVKVLSYQKQENSNGKNSKICLDLFKVFLAKIEESFSNPDWMGKKIPNVLNYFKFSKFKITNKKPEGIQMMQNPTSYPEYHFYYNLLLKITKVFRFNMNLLFKHFADIICTDKPISQFWIFTVTIILSFRYRGLVSYKFDLLILYGITRLLTFFTPKDLKFFFQFALNLSNANTISFASLNCILSYLEKFIFKINNNYHPKHIKNFDIPTTSFQNPEALLFHLKNSIDSRIEKKESAIEEEGKDQVPEGLNLCNKISVESLLENARILAVFVYCKCMAYAPYGLKSRAYTIVRQVKINAGNSFVWMSLFATYSFHLPTQMQKIVPRIDELDTMTEMHKKLFKKFKCILRGVRKIKSKESKEIKKIEEKEESLEIKEETTGNETETEPEPEPEPTETEETKEDPSKATQDVLEYFKRDTDQEEEVTMQPKLKKVDTLKTAFYLRETNYKLFRATISNLEESGENLQNLSLFLLPILRLPNFSYPHLRILIPKLNKIFNAETAKQDSEKSGFLSSFRQLSDRFLPSLLLADFKMNRNKMISLFSGEFEKSNSLIFQQFLVHGFISACLREYSKSNCRTLVSTLPRFLEKKNFLLNMYVYQSLIKMFGFTWNVSFESVFEFVMDFVESSLALEEKTERNTQGASSALLFCACLASNRKPKPDLLKRMLKCILMLIRSDLEDRTYIDKSRDCLKNYNEILKPQIDLDCYQYDKKDVKQILDLSGGLNYFA